MALTKILRYGETNFHTCEGVQQDRCFRRWGEVGGAKRELWTDLLRHERITGRSEVWRAYKYSAQYPWVLRGSLEVKYRMWPFQCNHINENRKILLLSIDPNLIPSVSLLLALWSEAGVGKEENWFWSLQWHTCVCALNVFLILVVI